MKRAISTGASGAVLAAVLSACTLAPPYERPTPPVRRDWPLAQPQASGPLAADLGWRQMFPDQRLQALIELALSQNRDLRVAVGDIERARALSRVQRSQLLPGIDATLSNSRTRTPGGVSATGRDLDVEQYSASVGFAAYELDLFGRVRSLNAAALQTYLAAEENRRAAQISLVAELVTTYAGLAADQELLRVSQDALRSREASATLSRRRFEAGAASQLDLRQAETLVEQARSDAAIAAALVEQDRNALELLAGAPVPQALLPEGGLGSIQIARNLRPGLPSEILVRRPDVLAAEHALQARNADIGAARAAFFPRISLTGSTGSASPDLDGLFSGGSGTWTFAPQISLPLFRGGANVANLGAARAGRDIAVAQYEKAVQTAFREVADALAVRATIAERLAAQNRLAAAAADTRRLTQARYDEGVDSYLAVLDAQRTLYDAQRSLVGARLAELVNRVTLFRTLGGGADAG